MAGEKILFVDDERTICKIMVSRLVSRQYVVESVTNGSEVFERAKKSRPQLIILDQQMPGMTGVEVCQKLKADPDLRDIPVLFFTGNPRTNLEDECVRAGALGVAYKPEVGALLDLIKRIFAGEKIDWGAEDAEE
jgi:CheY-like chemotaxis protein